MDMIKALGAEAAQYVKPDSAAALEGLPADSWGTLVEACLYMFDDAEPGIACHVVKTHETLADFEAARDQRWSQKGEMSAEEFNGRPARTFEAFQCLRGQPRRDSVVIDLGECRAVLWL